MARPTNTTPTDAEFAILRVLWEQGDCTVRQVFDVIAKHRKISPSTISKLMATMADKGLLETVDYGLPPQLRQPSVYRAVKDQESTVKSLLTHLQQNIYSKSPGRLIVNLISHFSMTRAEQQEIQAALKKMRKQ